MGIILKNTTEIAKMREAGRIVREVLDAVELACAPGVTSSTPSPAPITALEP